MRFDYDCSEAFRELDHPRSHLTLGEYTKCRIPVNRPLTPLQFADFVFRNFYAGVRSYTYMSGLPGASDSFPESIEAAEREVIHIQVPN